MVLDIIMTHRKTYRLFDDDERELVYEDILNESGQILSFKDYQAPNQTEGINEYNLDGVLTCEKEIIDGEEGSRTEYTYDSDGNITCRRLFVAGELFEELSHEYLESGFIKRRTQNNEEIERFIENKNGNKFLREFFEGPNLYDRHAGE